MIARRHRFIVLAMVAWRRVLMACRVTVHGNEVRGSAIGQTGRGKTITAVVSPFPVCRAIAA
jgi:hypothetical protein